MLHVLVHRSVFPCSYTHCCALGWLNPGLCCLDTFRQKLDLTRETRAFVCQDNSHSSSPVFVCLPALSFKEKASTLSTVPPTNRRFWTCPMVSTGFSALMSFPSQRKNGVSSLLPPCRCVFEGKDFALEFGGCQGGCRQCRTQSR